MVTDNGVRNFLFLPETSQNILKQDAEKFFYRC